MLKHTSISTDGCLPDAKHFHIMIDHYISGHTSISLIVDGVRLSQVTYDRRFENEDRWYNAFILLGERMAQAQRLGFNVHEMRITDRLPNELADAAICYVQGDD